LNGETDGEGYGFLTVIMMFSSLFVGRRKSTRVSTRLNLGAVLPLVEPDEKSSSPRRKRPAPIFEDSEDEVAGLYDLKPPPLMSEFLSTLTSLQENHVEVFAGTHNTAEAWKQAAIQKWGLLVGKATVDGAVPLLKVRGLSSSFLSSFDRLEKLCAK
jgi:hypothetical protein